MPSERQPAPSRRGLGWRLGPGRGADAVRDARRRVGAVPELHRLGHRRVVQVHGEGRGGRTRPRVGGEAPLDQLHQAHRLVLDHRLQRRPLRGQLGRRAGEAEPRQRADRVDVGRRGGRRAHEHLRGGEALGAVQRLRPLAEQPGDAEVADHRPALAREQHVARGEVGVDHAEGVQVRHGPADRRQRGDQPRPGAGARGRRRPTRSCRRRRGRGPAPACRPARAVAACSRTTCGWSRAARIEASRAACSTASPGTRGVPGSPRSSAGPVTSLIATGAPSASRVADHTVPVEPAPIRRVTVNPGTCGTDTKPPPSVLSCQLTRRPSSRPPADTARPAASGSSSPTCSTMPWICPGSPRLSPGSATSVRPAVTTAASSTT